MHCSKQFHREPSLRIIHSSQFIVHKFSFYLSNKIPSFVYDTKSVEHYVRKPEDDGDASESFTVR